MKVHLLDQSDLDRTVCGRLSNDVSYTINAQDSNCEKCLDRLQQSRRPRIER